MESLLASRAAFVRGLHVCRDNGAANSTFALSLQGALDIASEREQAVDEISVGKHDDALDGQEPALPLLLVDDDAITAQDDGLLERVC